MSLPTALRPLDPTPRRPETPLAGPAQRLTVEVDVACAHLANPTTAIGRLLSSEAQALAHVLGDDERIVITVALPDESRDARDAAIAWVRWVVHNAGVRGTVRVLEDGDRRVA